MSKTKHIHVRGNLFNFLRSDPQRVYTEISVFQLMTPPPFGPVDPSGSDRDFKLFHIAITSYAFKARAENGISEITGHRKNNLDTRRWCCLLLIRIEEYRDLNSSGWNL